MKYVGNKKGEMPVHIFLGFLLLFCMAAIGVVEALGATP